ADYSANPGGQPSFSSGGDYFDVYLATGNSFSAVEITLCGTGDLAYWWNGNGWLLASSYVVNGGCTIVTVDATTSPSLNDLHGTPFALGSVATTSFSNVTSPTIAYGTGSTTLSGTISSSTASPTGTVSI